MRRRVATALFRIFIFLLVAGMGTVLLAEDCPQTEDAIDKGGIEPNGVWITTQCPDACGSLQNRPTFLRWYQQFDGLDVIVMWCNADAFGPGREIEIPSTHSCWNCMAGCAGELCPEGELCLPVATKPDSDCRRWGCRDPINYEVVEGLDGFSAYCRRKTACPPATDCTMTTVQLYGRTTIRTGTTCTWTADIWTGCDPAGYTYHWYIGHYWVGSGQDYTGGRPGWVPSGPWTLRVDAYYGSHYAGSREIQIDESPTVRICPT